MSEKSDNLPFSYYTTLDHRRNSRDTTLLSTGITKLHFLFDIERFSIKVFIVILVSIFMGTYNFFILQRTGLYSLGINSIFQSIARCVKYFLVVGNYEVAASASHIILFWGMSLLLNIPMSIFGFKRIGKKFATLSLIVICVSSCTSILLSSLPKSWGLHDFYLFSDPRTFDSEILKKEIHILQWNQFTQIKNSSKTCNGEVVMNDSSRVILIFVYGVALGLLNTVSSVFIYSLGGSTGGMDWILYYFVKKKRKRIQTLYFYISVLIAFIAYLIGTYIPYAHYMLNNANTTHHLNNVNHAIISSFIGPMFVATVIAALIKRIMFHLFYPHFKIISVKIFTNKSIEFRRQLLRCKFPQAFTINAAIGGFMLRNQTVFDITCFALDLKMLKELAKEVDPQCLIVAMPIKSLSGHLVVRDNIS